MDRIQDTPVLFRVSTAGCIYRHFEFCFAVKGYIDLKSRIKRETKETRNKELKFISVLIQR